MNIHAIICTRSRENISETTDRLLAFFHQCNIKIYLMSGATSIFDAYLGAYQKINPHKEDILIFCHDDIEIRESPHNFLNIITSSLKDDAVGFIGVAGTTYLGDNAVWWDQAAWQAHKHRGRVTHLLHADKAPEAQYGKSQQIFEEVTFYGPPGDVAVMDGLFLATTPKVVDAIGLQKPKYFKGNWDFYDIYYTSQAFLKGYTNKVVDINILHASRGEIAGKDSWHKNRESFIAQNNLPLVLHD